MSKEDKPKRTRSTKKTTAAARAAELEAKIAELEARLASLSPQTGTSEARLQQRAAPEEPTPSYAEPAPGEVSPAYSKISSTSYTGNKYYATRARLAYHPPDKQFRGTSTSTARPSPGPEREYAPEPSTSYRDTMREERKQERRSMWKAKGASYEDYTPEHERRAPPPPREEPKPRAAPRPESKPAPRREVAEKVEMPQAAGEVAPAYATISSTSYTGNKYYATRKRMSYHPPNKQFTGASTTGAPPIPAPEPPKKSRGTLPAGFKP